MTTLEMVRNDLINSINETKKSNYITEKNKGILGLSQIKTDYTKWYSNKIISIYNQKKSGGIYE